MRQRIASGFTLVELLVVITIIAILTGLLLTGVQAAREAGRRAQCKNNLGQIAKACLSHEEAQRFLPTGGWGYQWVGDPDRGYDKKQPGGWAYNILNYLGMETAWSLGAGKSDSDKGTEIVKRLSGPISLYICPTRRPADVFPLNPKKSFLPGPMAPPPAVCRTDYAANTGCGGAMKDEKGTTLFPWSSMASNDNEGASPATLAQGDTLNDVDWSKQYSTKFNGVCFRRSMVRNDDILDGAGCTYLVGEKFLSPDHYSSGEGEGDDVCVFSGHDPDVLRQANQADLGGGTTDTTPPPTQDRSFSVPSPAYQLTFGSPHASGWNVAFCDGSVRTIAYAQTPDVHARQANRTDLQRVDQSGP
jgi:prepilin-type N-terminal cleavage/methylation domain-containing protein/prepilin-type processing-associated H-X9-DG protein